MSMADRRAGVKEKGADEGGRWPVRLRQREREGVAGFWIEGVPQVPGRWRAVRAIEAARRAKSTTTPCAQVDGGE